MKTILFEVSLEEQEKFKKITEGLDIVFREERLDESTIAKAQEADIISTFVGSVVNKDLLASLPNLKFLTTRSTGFDHMDTVSAKERGIPVANVPAYGSETVAEFAFALILTLSRKVFDAVDRIKDDDEYSIHGLRGFDLNSKTLGVIGTGKIGKNVIKMAKGFNMRVLAYDLYPDQPYAEAMGFEYKTLDEVIQGSDVITIHAPYNQANHHLINRDKVAQMKRGVYLVNTARGELLETEALLWGLKEGIIAGAGLDVLEGERNLSKELEVVTSPGMHERVEIFKTLLQNHELMKMKNVVITPHIAFYTEEAESRIRQVTIENIKAFIDGKPINLVN